MKNYLNATFTAVTSIATLLVFLDGADSVKACQQADHIPIIPPKPRLQMDIAKGSPDLQWSRDAKNTRDQRPRWWREARLGCFIHWNDASQLAVDSSTETAKRRETAFRLGGMMAKR